MTLVFYVTLPAWIGKTYIFVGIVGAGYVGLFVLHFTQLGEVLICHVGLH